MLIGGRWLTCLELSKELEDGSSLEGFMQRCLMDVLRPSHDSVFINQRVLEEGTWVAGRCFMIGFREAKTPSLLFFLELGCILSFSNHGR